MIFGHLVDQNEKSDDYDRLPEGVKNEDLPKYEKVMGWEPSHPMLKRLKKEFNTAKKSEQEKPLILLEGKRIIQDAMNAGFYPKTFVFSRLNLLGDIPFDTSKDINMVQIPYKNIKVWSDLSTSPGIMGKYLFQQSWLNILAKSYLLKFHYTADQRCWLDFGRCTVL